MQMVFLIKRHNHRLRTPDVNGVLPFKCRGWYATCISLTDTLPNKPKHDNEGTDAIAARISMAVIPRPGLDVYSLLVSFRPNIFYHYYITVRISLLAFFI